MLKLLTMLGLSLALGIWLISLPTIAGAGLTPTAYQPGVITISVVAALPSPGAVTRASNSTAGFNFSGDLGNFTLGPNEYREFPGLAAGPYTVLENVPDEWTLANIICDNGVNLPTPDPPQVTINLQSNEAVHCTFNNFANYPPLMYWSFLPIVLR